MKKITIKTELLLSVSRWTSDGHTRPHLRVVLFKDNEMIACDGERLVRVPVACNGLTVAIDRDMAAAVAAMQSHCKESAPRDEEYRGRAIDITVDGKVVVLDAGRFKLHGPTGDAGAYPPYDRVMPTKQPERHPDGYGFDPKFLAAIHEVQVAAGSVAGSQGVRITGWSADGLGAMLFEGYCGIRYVIMPVLTTLRFQIRKKATR